ncbi:hypothetical protein [Flavobacterium sp. LS2R12]|uniref:hypothetical protein n=1 Tax=unclassified Flavobacterium TaxID=196869 RepID=UPI003AB095E0
MKQILLLIILCLSISSWSNSTVNFSKIDSLELKINKLEMEIKKDSLNTYNKEIINEYKYLNNLYSVGFGILIALFGLVFPVILYFVQIKPNIETTKETKALVKKLDEDFGKSFEEHLKKNKDRLVNQAIENFEKLEEHNLPTNYNLLDTYKTDSFNENQVIRLLKLIKNKDFEDGNKTFFASILTYQEDSNIEDYFVDLLQTTPKDEKCIYGAIYFRNYNKTEYYDLIADIILNGYSLEKMIISLASTSKQFTIGLLNNEHLMNKIMVIELVNVCHIIENNNLKFLNKYAISETLMWKRYIGN